MGFILKKIISALLLPLSICWLCMLLGLCLLKSHRRWAYGLWLTATAILFIFGNGSISYQLIHELEKSYPPLSHIAPDVTTVVVLAGGTQNNAKAPVNQQLGNISTARLIEGIRCVQLIKKHHHKPQLVLSGGSVFGSHTEGQVMAATVKLLQLAADATITVEQASRDTADQAAYLHKTLGIKPFVLVTSASHMPRSMMLFEQLGMHPIAAPANTHSAPSHGPWLLRLLPNANNLATSDTAIHEYLGYIWSRWLYRAAHA